MENFLVCLTGLPASGKTTFANKLKSSFIKKQGNFEVTIIDPDIIRREIAPNKFDYQKEQIVRKMNLELIRNVLKKGHVAICDDLNYYTSMRHDIKKITDDINIRFFIIHISTPLEICLKWNEIRGKPIPNKIIENINKKFDNFGKYIWEIPFASFDLSRSENLDNLIENLTEKIFQNMRFAKKIEDVKDFKRIQSNSNNEKLDKITREIVGKLLRNPIFQPLKKKIIKSRKKFVKTNVNKPLDEGDISKEFKDYLEKSLNLKVS